VRPDRVRELQTKTTHEGDYKMSEHEERFSRERIAEMYEESAQPGFMAAMLTAMDDRPVRFRDMGLLATAVQSLREIMDPCSCGQPDCLAAPAHREMYEDEVDQALDVLEAAFEQMKEALIDMDHRVNNCHCAACETKQARANSWLN
jgi:hypothetical protein